MRPHAPSSSSPCRLSVPSEMVLVIVFKSKFTCHTTRGKAGYAAAWQARGCDIVHGHGLQTRTVLPAPHHGLLWWPHTKPHCHMPAGCAREASTYMVHTRAPGGWSAA